MVLKDLVFPSKFVILINVYLIITRMSMFISSEAIINRQAEINTNRIGAHELGDFIRNLRYLSEKITFPRQWFRRTDERTDRYLELWKRYVAKN